MRDCLLDHTVFSGWFWAAICAYNWIKLFIAQARVTPKAEK